MQDLFNRSTTDTFKLIQNQLDSLQQRVRALESKQSATAPKPTYAGIDLEFLTNCGLGHLIRKTDPEEVDRLKEDADRIDKRLDYLDQRMDKITSDVHDRLTQAEDRVIILAISLIVTAVIALSAIYLAVKS